MAQFQVPQFIEVEDKIFGPLTFKQFIYVLGAGSISFIFWVLLPKWLAVIFIIPVASFFLALAFLKVNGQPLIKVISNAVSYSTGSRLYTWKKKEQKTYKNTKEVTKKEPQLNIPTLTENKLKELAWSLDIHKKVR